jgi:Family of unknown function (DUF5681)
MAKKKSTGAPTDYEIGRGKPPKQSQFRKGQSGNPGGRKKGSRNLKQIVQAIAESEIELTEHGKKRVVSLIEALLLSQAKEGLRGNTRATESLLDRIERLCGADDTIRVELPEEDDALLDRVFSRKRRLKSAPRSAQLDEGLCPPGNSREADDE